MATKNSRSGRTITDELVKQTPAGPVENDPIKHTTGGEIPDPAEVAGRRYRPEDFRDIGGAQPETGGQPQARAQPRQAPSQSWYGGGGDMGAGIHGAEGSMGLREASGFLRGNLPLLLYGVGLGLGLYFLFRRSGRYREEGEAASEEARRAMDVDAVPPSRMMGA